MKNIYKVIIITGISCMLFGCISLTPTAPKEEVTQVPANDLLTLANEDNITGIKSLFKTETDIHAMDERGNTALHIAAINNNASLIQFLINEGANSTLTNFSGDTPLHCAIKNNANDAAKVLAAQGDNIFIENADGKNSLEQALTYGTVFLDSFITEHTATLKDKNENTVAHYIVKSNNLEGIEKAIQAQHPLSEKNLEGKTPLSLAYSQDNLKSIEIATKLLLNNVTPERGEYSFFEDAIKMRNPNFKFDEGQTPLHIATYLGKNNIVEYLIKNGANPNTKDSFGNTALHIATSEGQYEIARLLLQNGADVNSKDALGNTPLLLVNSEKNQLLMFKLLINNGAKINVATAFGDTVLHNTTLKGSNIEVLEYLIDNGAIIDERNKEGNTPLAQAVANRNLEHIRFYSQKGADIHATNIHSVSPLLNAFVYGIDVTKILITKQNITLRDSMGNTPLHIAIENNASIEEIEFLMDMGAEIDARNRDGESVLYFAVKKNNRLIGEKLLAQGADVFYAGNNNASPLLLALSSENDSQEWLLTSEVIKAQDSLGNTPLHIATEYNLNDAILNILEKGADPNIQNTNGESPIFIAVEKNNITAVEILLLNGAEKNLRNYLGNTILHTSIKANAKDAAYVALKNGFDVNAQNSSGKTALHIAAQENNIEMMNLLLEQNADIHCADIIGRTPLMDAIKMESIQTIQYLLANGASALISEMYGRNAFHEAVETKNLQIIEIIEKAGANPLGRDSYGTTPLSIAFKDGLALTKAVLADNLFLSDSDGNTPLHIAVTESVNSEILEYLLQEGYSANRRNSEGTTPLLLAVKKGDLEVTEMFLKEGADPFISNNSGQNAVSYAIENNTSILKTIAMIAGSKQDVAGDTILHYAARISDKETIDAIIKIGVDPKVKNVAGETAEDVAKRWGRNIQ